MGILNLGKIELDDVIKMKPIKLITNENLVFSTPVDDPDNINSSVVQYYQGSPQASIDEKLHFELIS